MRLVDTTGQQIFRSDDGDLISVETREYFSQAMSGNEFVSEVLESKTTGGFIIVLSVPVRDASGQVIGIIHRNYNLDFVGDIINSVANDITIVNIVDREGLLIDGSTQDVTVETGRPDYSGDSVVQKVLSGETGVTLSNYTGSNSIVAYTRNESTGWGIVVEVDFDGAMKSSYMTISIIIGIGVALLVIAALIGFKISKSFANPISATSGMAGEMAKGNLTTEDVKVNSNNEIAEMADAVNDMKARLNDVIKNTKISSKDVGSESISLSAISEENAASAQETNASMEELNATFQLISDSAKNLQNLANSLGQNISYFQV